MIIRLSEENAFQAIEFIKKHHKPENGSFIDIDLVDGLFRRINNKLYENNEFPPFFLQFFGDSLNAIVCISKSLSDYDFNIPFFAIDYKAIVDIFNMSLLHGKKVNIIARSIYSYQHLISYFGKTLDKSYQIYYQYDRKADIVNINKEYIIKEIIQDEHYYRFELYIGENFISQCYISDMLNNIVPEYSDIRKVWGITALRTAQQYRGYGYASIITMYAVNKILEFGGVPLYWTDYDNIASQRNAQKCGFSPVYRGIDFITVL